MDVAALQSLYAEIFAPWVRDLDLVVLAAADDTVTLRLPVGPRHVHAGGVVSGQTLMAAADTALVLALSHVFGGFRQQSTVQLQTSFLRPVPADARELRVKARILKRGRQLVFGEVALESPDGRLAAQATATIALL
ncbi:MAG TPA: PaaI family thioesterase [Burkholderiaceae bacterium]